MLEIFKNIFKKNNKTLDISELIKMVSLKVTVYSVSSIKEPYTGTILSLSEKEVKFVSKDKFPIDRKYKISFSLPDGTTVENIEINITKFIDELFTGSYEAKFEKADKSEVKKISNFLRSLV